MRDGFFKKVAIGITASLVSAGIIALVSGLFTGSDGSLLSPSDSSSAFAGICTHENRIEVNGTEATCTVAGVAGAIRCTDCGEIVVQGEEVPALGHTGEIGEYCSVCEEPIYGAMQNPNYYNLVSVEDGETIAGNWYRLIRPSPDVYPCENVNCPTFCTDAEWTGDWYYMPELWFYAYPYCGDCSECNWRGDGFVSSAGPMGAELKEMKFFITDDYIDIYIEAGTYTCTTEANVQVTITELTTISVGDEGNYIKRIVFSD